MRHIAREGRCWVVASGVAIQACDIPDAFPEKHSVFPDPDEWVRPGGSVLVAPGGVVAAGPLRHECGVLHGEIDLALVAKGRRVCDVAGHYSRRVCSNCKSMTHHDPVTFSSHSDANAGDQSKCRTHYSIFKYITVYSKTSNCHWTVIGPTSYHLYSVCDAIYRACSV